MSDMSISAVMEGVSYSDPSSMHSIHSNPKLSEEQKEQIAARIFDAQLIRPMLKSALNPDFVQGIGEKSMGSSTQKEMATDLLVECLVKSDTASFGISNLMEMKIKGQK